MRSGDCGKWVLTYSYCLSFLSAPSNVVGVSVKARSEVTITFEWYKVGNNNAYAYILRQSNSKEALTPVYWGGAVATQTVSSLSPGTKYNFTLYTVFGGERSRGYNFSAVTSKSEQGNVKYNVAWLSLVCVCKHV